MNTRNSTKPSNSTTPSNSTSNSSNSIISFDEAINMLVDLSTLSSNFFGNGDDFYSYFSPVAYNTRSYTRSNTRSND